MTAPKTVHPPDAQDIFSPPIVRDPLARRIKELALQERDAVRRRDWSAARVAAEERVALQAAQQRADARRLA